MNFLSWYKSIEKTTCRHWVQQMSNTLWWKREAQRDQGQYTTLHGFLQNIGIPFIYSLINEIQDAFHYSGVLSAFGFLDPRNLPSDVEYLHDYGEGCIELMKIQLLIYQINLKLHFFITDSQVKWIKKGFIYLKWIMLT